MHIVGPPVSLPVLGQQACRAPRQDEAEANISAASQQLPRREYLPPVLNLVKVTLVSWRREPGSF